MIELKLLKNRAPDQSELPQQTIPKGLSPERQHYPHKDLTCPQSSVSNPVAPNPELSLTSFRNKNHLLLVLLQSDCVDRVDSLDTIQENAQINSYPNITNSGTVHLAFTFPTKELSSIHFNHKYLNL